MSPDFLFFENIKDSQKTPLQLACMDLARLQEAEFLALTACTILELLSYPPALFYINIDILMHIAYMFVYTYMYKQI
jgi:hypothetical protein